ncbi:N/A [soil metagenome]
MEGPSQFTFLNQIGDVLDPNSWNDSARGKLWLYNLHYFDDLAAAGWSGRRAWQRGLITRWIRENPPGTGVGWDPYPTSRRIVNWIKWALAGNALEFEHLHSMAVQARWLATRVEYHIGGNHLIANAKALLFAGLYFDGSEADDWRETGLRLLQRELAVQLLADGGHYERSPMYHAVVLEDLLDLINAGCAWCASTHVPPFARWHVWASRMLAWLLAMVHPDGEISFFNDSALGVGPPPDELSCYAERLGVPIPRGPATLGESGYVRAECAPALLIADLAPVGPDHQPGHAHADTLSFEFSLFGHRLLVNSGTSTYEPSGQRQYERSTAAHNTVEINGHDSSEVWSAFRVARRARPLDVAVTDSGTAIHIRGAHDGYRRLRGQPLHLREWRLTASELTVVDRVLGRFDCAIARFYFHPAVKLHGDRTLELPNGTTCQWRNEGGNARVVRARWFPTFGCSQENHCLEVTLAGTQGNTVTLDVTW